MRDIDIRVKIKNTYLKKYYIDNHSKVIDEFNVSLGEARMDIAVVNGSLHGYEIKSELDTLNRLPTQILTYSKTFDYLTIVTGEKHLDNVLNIVPEWWGVIVASYNHNKSDIKLRKVRKAKKNVKIDKLSLAQLLWKEEILEILRAKEIKKGLSKPKPFLWGLLVEAFSVKDLSNIVRAKIKTRELQKSVLLPVRNDDCFQLVSTL